MQSVKITKCIFLFQTTLPAKMTITEVFPNNATVPKTTENKTEDAAGNTSNNSSTNNNVLNLLGLQQPSNSTENTINETANAATLQPTIRGGMTAEVE